MKKKKQLKKPKKQSGYGFAIAGFVCSFFIAALGIIFSAIALSRLKPGQKGRGLAVAGLVIGIVSAFLGFLWFLMLLGFAAYA